MTCFLADPATPQPVGTTSSGGSWPRDIALSPDGTLLFAANQKSGTVTVFTIDNATGTPTPTGTTLNVQAPCSILPIRLALASVRHPARGGRRGSTSTTSPPTRVPER